MAGRRLRQRPVLRDRPARVPAEERAHAGHAEQRGSADAGAQVIVDLSPQRLVRVQVVVVVADRGQVDAMPGKQPAYRLGLGGGQALDVDMSSGVVAAPGRPGRDFKDGEPAARRPPGNRFQIAIGQACGEEAKFHRHHPLPEYPSGYSAGF